MSAPVANVLTKASLPTKVYQRLIKGAEPFVPKKLQPLWNHPAGKINARGFLFITFSLMNYDEWNSSREVGSNRRKDTRKLSRLSGFREIQ